MYRTAKFLLKLIETGTKQVFLGIDPGKSKCGLALMGIDRKLWLQEIVAAAATIGRVETILAQYPVSIIVLGNGTTSKSWQVALKNYGRVVIVDEKYSTLEARQKYWQLYPPQGIARFIPPQLRFLPPHLDDIVALILIERYLSQLTSS